MRNKQTNKPTTPKSDIEISPSAAANIHKRQASQSQNFQYYKDILTKFAPQENEEETKVQSQEKVRPRQEQQFEVEDIADDSEEEKSIKQLNIFQIKTLDTNIGVKQAIVKNFSEHDFLVKDQQRDNSIRLFKDFHQIHFKFDNILIPKDSQESVFSKISAIVQGFMVGMNGTIFAYGQTGAGKTYSIIGGESRGFELMPSAKRGVLPRTLDQVFSPKSLSAVNSSSKFYVSFYEIYNEKIFDLLGSSAPQQQNSSQKRSTSRGGSQKPKLNLEIREEKDGHFSIPDLRKFEVKSLEEAYQYLDKGLLKRSTSSTSSNNKSSRSHSVFQIFMEKETETGIIIRSKIRIVDLAGSEKYTIKKDLPPVEKNLKVQELTSINSSLSALGQCISALSDPSRKHIPYRNSKLTKILKDSLDESSNVALIICVSPSVDSYKETLSTLQFADRAKKAILDGRNFSDSKLLLAGGSQQQSSQESMNNILKAYQEEKAIRKGLEQFVRENTTQFEVFEELERLKKQNRELQDKVKLLELNQASGGNNDNESQPKQIKSCLKKQSSNKPIDQSNSDKSEVISINIIPIRNQQSSSTSLKDQLSLSPTDPEQPKKRVRFAQKLDNDQSIDSDMRERIEHNLKYNDDTIFDNISIFRDIDNSGIVLLPRKLKQKDVHPSRLKDQLPIEDDEEEEEQNKNINEQEEEKKDKVSNENVDQQQNMPNLINSLHDDNLKEFWALPVPQKNNQRKIVSINDEDGVSPIGKARPEIISGGPLNNSSQDLSKDLIDLNNDQALKKLQEQDTSSNISDLRIGDKTMGTSKVKKNQQMKGQSKNSHNLEGMKGIELFQGFESEIKHSDNHEIDCCEEEDVECVEDQEAKDYHVCDSSEQFFENDFQVDQPMIQQVNYGQNDQMLTDSMMIMETQNEEIINCNEDNQNTLILDSQSIIIEGCDQNNNRDPNLSQHMQLLEASSIFQQRDLQSNQLHNQQQFFFSLGGANSQSNANSSNLNTDILTYSLTNTFSTIESLHDELAMIRTGLELSQKRSSNIIKTIHKYAREIEDNKISDYYHSQQQPPLEDFKEEESHIKVEEDENIIDNSSSILEKDISQFEEENLNFIKDIKGFYSKIHNEITQLKNILMDSAKNNNNNSPLSSRKHIISEKVPQKQQLKMIQMIIPTSSSDEKQSTTETPKHRNSIINIDCIDKSQEIINELRKEMEHILTSNKKENKNHTKSLRVLDLLEVLQQSLVQAVTPQKYIMTSESKNKESGGSSSVAPKQQRSGGKSQFKQDHQTSLKVQVQNKAHFMNHQPHQHINTVNLEGKNIIQYEELSSAQESPVKSDLQKPSNSSSYHQTQQRTPEIFKSLAKLDESEVNSSSVPCERDALFSNTQQAHQNQYPINQNIYFSQHSQNQQDFQITLRSYNLGGGGSNENHNHSNIENINLTQTEKKRSAVDNTLTLIFDSDEENSEEEECKDVIEEGENSPIFNDMDSQIERAGSFVNRNNNLITSNSFQGDNSLLFFENNIMGGAGEQDLSNINRQSSKGTRNLSFNQRADLINQSQNRNTFNEQMMLAQQYLGVTPEREKEAFLKVSEKKTNKKYLLPKSKADSSDVQLIPSKSHFYQPPPQLESIDDSAVNKSTSKNSVHKYWNQFFLNNNNSKSMKSNINEAIIQGGGGAALNQQQMANNSRNQQQYISRSAYQSNSFKDTSNDL